MQTIMITGCSSGFGLEIAKLFLDRGWKVIATMRKPDVHLFPASDNLQVLPLDVTSATSIAQAVAEAGDVDVLVNNAGIGLLSVLEGTPTDLARHIFETNFFGTFAMTQAVVPQMRERRAGMIVNVTSSVTLRALPLLATYSASKAAVNAFTSSLALELAPFNVKAKLVLPGRSPSTRFGENAMPLMEGAITAPYAEMAQAIITTLRADTGDVTYAEDVAEAVWRSVTDPAAPDKLPAGKDAIEWAKDAGVA